jgi:hypothetical protein
MEPIRKSPRGPPVGYVIDSQRYFTVAEAIDGRPEKRISNAPP